MALKRKQNSSRPSAMTSNTNSNQAAVTCKHKHSGIRGFLQILPFLQCFKQKIKSIEKTSLHKTKPSSSLNDHDIRKLIRLYEGHENLYNPRHADYGDVNYDDACFSIIASYFPSRSSAELKSCINELRLLFEREYIIIENGYRRFGELLQPTIKYYHEFMFLVPFLRFYWDSGLYLPPKESSTDDGVSQNSCTSDGTDRTMPSCVDLTGAQLKRPTGGKCLFFGKKNVKQKTEDRKSKEDKMKEEAQSMENKVTEDYYTSEQDQLTTSSSQLQLPSPRRSLHKTDEESSPKLCKITCNGGQRLTSRPETPAEANSRPSIPSHSVHGAQSSAQAPNASRHSVNEAESQARASNASHHSVNGAQGKARASNASRHSVNAAENKSRLSNASRHPEPVAEHNSRPSNASRQSVQGAQSTARASNASRHSVNENKSRPSVASQSCSGSTDRAPYYCAQSSSATQEQHYSACSSQPIYPGNREQLEMLCEMIKLELSVAPDFIYYDAKWRIIEILREVQKRKSIHCRAEPGPRGQTVQHPASGQQPMSSNLPQQQPGQDPQCICHSPANCCQREEPTNCCKRDSTPTTRIRCPAQAKRCPYCCKR